jgi:hypothetical protein
LKEQPNRLSRRDLFRRSGVAVLGAATLGQASEGDNLSAQIAKISNPEIRAGVEAAVRKNMLPAATEKVYPGHFTISADGDAYGADTTWPGLDSWQMAGAYLLIGKSRLVTDYFDFVRASQRKDGNIPFAIFNGETRPGDTYLRGMKYPDDLFTYTPPKREGLSPDSQTPKQWIGLYRHWELKSDPLSTLGPICYLLTGAEIYDSTHDMGWLKDHLPSLVSTAKYLSGRITDNGLLGGSGFYTELPPRCGWDGVTQCYGVHGFRELARLLKTAGQKKEALDWSHIADQLATTFVQTFWREDHFAEYVHVDHGIVDSHGLSDTNWAAVAFGVADDNRSRIVWERLTKDASFWPGDMPTTTVTKPFSYEPWEADPVPFGIPSLTNDVAAMGRVWYLEAMACKRMGDDKRLHESTLRVCRAAIDGYWRERYHPQADGGSKPGGGEKYCEYPSVLVRVVLGSPNVFRR